MKDFSVLSSVVKTARRRNEAGVSVTHCDENRTCIEVSTEV